MIKSLKSNAALMWLILCLSGYAEALVSVSVHPSKASPFTEYRWVSSSRMCTGTIVVPGLGGPGYSISRELADYVFNEIRGRGTPCKIVLYEIPGTGQTTAMQCDEGVAPVDCVTLLKRDLDEFKYYSAEYFADRFSEQVRADGHQEIILLGTSYSGRIAALMALQLPDAERVILTNPSPFSDEDLKPQAVLLSEVLTKLRNACYSVKRCRRMSSASDFDFDDFKDQFESSSTVLLDKQSKPIVKTEFIKVIRDELAFEGPVSAMKAVMSYHWLSTHRKGSAPSGVDVDNLNLVHLDAVHCNDYKELSNDDYKAFNLGVYGQRWGDPSEFSCGYLERYHSTALAEISIVPLEVHVDLLDPVVSHEYAESYRRRFSCITIFEESEGRHQLLPKTVTGFSRDRSCA